MLTGYIFALLMGSSSATVRVRVDPVSRYMFVNITARNFNNDNPFEVALDNQLFTILNDNLYRGPVEEETQSINFITSNDSTVPVGGIVWRRYTFEQGFVGIGAGSALVDSSGPINIMTREGTIDRFLTLNARDFLDFFYSCERNTVFSVPYGSSLEHSGLVNVRFAFQYTPSDGSSQRRLVGSEFEGPVTLSGESSAGVNYMTVPESFFMEIGRLLTQMGAVATGQGRLRFDQCDQEMIARLPDLLISFLNHGSELIGSLIQLPEDYMILNSERRSCEARFILHNGPPPYAMDPVGLGGVNVRLESNRIYFGEPRQA